MNFADAMRCETTKTLTENGAFAYNTTGEALLDLFAQGGALRSRTVPEIESKFAEAYYENSDLALRLLFYIGAIREGGGLGERRTFKICYHWLGVHYPIMALFNMGNVPFFTRWDNLFALMDTPCEDRMWSYVKKVLTSDIRAMQDGKPVTLLAKWMKSINSSSKETRRIARRACQAFGWSEPHYRRTLSALRRYLNVVEVKMTAQEWEDIVYESVPSYAMKNYCKAFSRHDFERFNAYVEGVKKGNKVIKASTLFPYDLIHEVLAGHYSDVVEQQWKALPNYVDGAHNFLVMSDVSGSMAGRPMETSIGLGIYFAQRNAGLFHNQFMTFTSDPRFIGLKDNDDLSVAVRKALRGCGYSTNLSAAMRKILDTCIAYNVPEEELPEALIVISDMEIDQYMRPGYSYDFMDTLTYQFHQAGYNKAPKLILWNVQARNDTFLSNREDVIFCSGQSAGTFKNLIRFLNGQTLLTATDFMLEVLLQKCFDRIVTFKDVNF